MTAKDVRVADVGGCFIWKIKYNNIMDLRKIHLSLTAEQASEMLVDLYQQSMEDAMICAVLIKSQIPMYTGNLNPVWKFWDDVTKLLMPDSTEDRQQAFIKELVSIDNPQFVK